LQIWSTLANKRESWVLTVLGGMPLSGAAELDKNVKIMANDCGNP
jgi:hypothetical protein